jgi:branched-chain amino acid transport system permease protein
VRNLFRQKLLVVELAVLALALTAPLGVDYYWQLQLTKIIILGIVALSFDLVWGYSGVLSFAQALFFGLAGYVCAVLSRDYGVSSAPLLLVIGMAAGLVSSLVVGLFIFYGRAVPSQVFIAVATLSASYVLDRLVRGWTYVGGQNGIPGLPRLTLGTIEIEEGWRFYYFAATLLVAIYLGLRALTRSQFGLVLVAIREDEARTAYFGYKTQYYKYLAFGLSGMIAGLSGTLYVYHESFVGPGLIGPAFSTQIVLYSLFGGAGTLIGSIVGVATIEVVGHFVSAWWEEGWPLIVGVLLLATVTVRPGGLISLLGAGVHTVRFGERFMQSTRKDKAADGAGRDPKPVETVWHVNGAE